MAIVTEKGERARAYLLEFPNSSKKNIAKILFNDFPHLYKSVEDARYFIRKNSGAAGKASREFKKKGAAPIKHSSGHSIDTPYGKPEVYAKILVIDIETSPIQAYVWGFWEQNINQAQVIKDWYVLTWSAKWLFEKTVYEGKLTPKEAIEGNDKRIIKSVWQMLNEADICITHNGDRFDFKKLNTRFLKWGMHPPMPFISIDTLKVNKKSFAHSSNKLEYINTSLELPRKMEHEGFPLWDLCCRGDAKALDRMSKYNTQDVIIQEAHYLRIRSWIKPHPNIAIHITDEKVETCPACGSDDLGAEKGKYATQTATYGVCRCKKCGSLSAGRVNQLSKERGKYIRKSLSK